MSGMSFERGMMPGDNPDGGGRDRSSGPSSTVQTIEYKDAKFFRYSGKGGFSEFSAALEKEGAEAVFYGEPTSPHIADENERKHEGNPDMQFLSLATNGIHTISFLSKTDPVSIHSWYEEPPCGDTIQSQILDRLTKGRAVKGVAERLSSDNEIPLFQGANIYDAEKRQVVSIFVPEVIRGEAVDWQVQLASWVEHCSHFLGSDSQLVCYCDSEISHIRDEVLIRVSNESSCDFAIRLQTEQTGMFSVSDLRRMLPPGTTFHDRDPYNWPYEIV